MSQMSSRKHKTTMTAVTNSAAAGPLPSMRLYVKVETVFGRECHKDQLQRLQYILEKDGILVRMARLLIKHFFRTDVPDSTCSNEGAVIAEEESESGCILVVKKTSAEPALSVEGCFSGTGSCLGPIIGHDKTRPLQTAFEDLYYDDGKQ
jgi:hypothetical protein